MSEIQRKRTVQLYTDGACSGNPGPGGWGCILNYNGKTKETTTRMEQAQSLGSTIGDCGKNSRFCRMKKIKKALDRRKDPWYYIHADCISTPMAGYAGVVQWQNPSLPSWSRGFDSHHPLHMRQ